MSAPPANYPSSAGTNGPKKETARIAILPEATGPVPTVKMSKTQPLIATPLAATQATRPLPRPAITTTSTRATTAPATVDALPTPLLWAACGMSAVALLIQIWNYFAG